MPAIRTEHDLQHSCSIKAASQSRPRPDSKVKSTSESKGINGNVKRPPNAFMLYRTEMDPIVRRDNPKMRAADVCSAVAKFWKAEPESVKQVYRQRSEALNEQHKKDHPDFKWVTRSTSNAAGKQKGKRSVTERFVRKGAKSRAIIDKAQCTPERSSPLPLLLHSSPDSVSSTLNEALTPSDNAKYFFPNLYFEPTETSPDLTSPAFSDNSLYSREPESLSLFCGHDDSLAVDLANAFSDESLVEDSDANQFFLFDGFEDETLKMVPVTKPVVPKLPQEFFDLKDLIDMPSFCSPQMNIVDLSDRNPFECDLTENALASSNTTPRREPSCMETLLIPCDPTTIDTFTKGYLTEEMLQVNEKIHQELFPTVWNMTCESLAPLPKDIQLALQKILGVEECLDEIHKILNDPTSYVCQASQAMEMSSNDLTSTSLEMFF